MAFCPKKHSPEAIGTEQSQTPLYLKYKCQTFLKLNHLTSEMKGFTMADIFPTLT